eukprot:4736866-Amphidinium_carterae.1
MILSKHIKEVKLSRALSAPHIRVDWATATSLSLSQGAFIFDPSRLGNSNLSCRVTLASSPRPHEHIKVQFGNGMQARFGVKSFRWK